MPEFKESKGQNGPISYQEGIKYRSFHDIMASISNNLSKYIKYVDIDSLEINKDYQYGRIKDLEINKEDTKLEFKNLNIESNLIENKHASKIIKNILTLKEAKTLEFGTKMHKSNNKYINNLRNSFDIDKALIYQELEFVFQDKETIYQGIIDLMLEYEDEIKIIDYKLKNIDDKEYIKQLNVYYKYVKSIKDKKISLYLYSILDNEVKTVEIMESV